MAKAFKRKWKNSKGEGCNWAYSYKDTFSKRRTVSGFKTKVAAEKALAEKLQEVENSANPEANKTLTFRQLTDKYLKYHIEIYLRESTYDTYTGF